MNSFLSETQKRKKQKFPNIVKIIKVEIPAAGAAITPPLGPVLGQYGMNTMEFCKEFNEESKLFEKETIVPTIIYLSADKNFYFELKIPGIAYFMKKYIESNEIEKRNSIYILDKKRFLQFLYDVALLKLNSFASQSINLKTDNKLLSTIYLKNYIRSVIGTARSFGIKFKE